MAELFPLICSERKISERVRIADRHGKTWTVAKVRIDQAETEDCGFWYEGLTSEERVETVAEALEGWLKTRGIDVVPDYEEFIAALKAHAVAFYARPRATKYLDILLEPTLANAQNWQALTAPRSLDIEGGLDGLIQFLEFAGVARTHQPLQALARNGEYVVKIRNAGNRQSLTAAKSHFCWELTGCPSNERDDDPTDVIENCISGQDHHRSVADWRG